MSEQKCLQNLDNHVTLSGVKTLQIPRVWGKFLRRLMGLQDGQYLLSFEIVDGKIATWREFIGGKAEQ